MSPDRWQQLQALFDEVCALPEVDQRIALERRCGDAAELREQLASLIVSARDGQNALDHPCLAEDAIASVAAEVPAAAAVTAKSRSGERIGPYVLEHLIAHGGMGEVYLGARADGHFDRRVAIKFVRAECCDREALRRFEDERRTLGALEHPHIARLLDSGTTASGHPYFVMEYVDGEPIDRYCERRSLSVFARVSLFRTVCAAVAYAHRRLIIHRDLKPSNILVTADGEPKLLDFGIAHLLATEAEEKGAGGGLPLTPDYASPEQLAGDRVTTAGDVYSLGVVLSELLTGQRPQRLATRPRPRGDLEYVLEKALTEKPESRYESVEQLTKDLERVFRHQPVAARPDTLRYRTALFLRRNRFAAGAVALIVVALIVGSVATLWQAREAARAHGELRIAYDQAQQVRAFLQDMLASASPMEDGPDLRVRELLDQSSERVDTQFQHYPEVRAALHATIGKSYLGLGLYDQAEAHLASALAMQRELHGNDHLEVAAAMNDLATALYEKAAYGEAERLLREALAIQRAHGAEETKEAAQLLNNLGAVQRMRGDFTGAEQSYRQALVLRRRLCGDQHLDVAETLNNLASVLRTRGEWPLVEDLARETLAIREALLPEDHPLVGQSLANLAVVLQSRGKLDEAEDLYREALDRVQARLGDHHPGQIPALINFATLLISRGDAPQAETLLRDGVRIATDTLPPTSWHGLEARVMLARSLLAQGKTAEARETAQLVWDALQRAPITDEGTALVARQLANYYQDAHEPERSAAAKRLSGP